MEIKIIWFSFRHRPQWETNTWKQNKLVVDLVNSVQLTTFAV